MFFYKKSDNKTYDKEKLKPVIRVSICTGEETAGFLELDTGKFHEAELIRSEQDLKNFMKQYNIVDNIERIY